MSEGEGSSTGQAADNDGTHRTCYDFEDAATSGHSGTLVLLRLFLIRAPTCAPHRLRVTATGTWTSAATPNDFTNDRGGTRIHSSTNGAESRGSANGDILEKWEAATALRDKECDSQTSYAIEVENHDGAT